MIIDKLENAHYYFSISENLKYALQYLIDHRDALKEAPCQITALTEQVQIKILEYDTIPTFRKWEAHHIYTDLQYMIEGGERMGYSDISLLHSPVKSEGKDQTVYQGYGNMVDVPEGFFVIFFPQDAHMSKLAAEEVAHVKKAAFKIIL